MRSVPREAASEEADESLSRGAEIAVQDVSVERVHDETAPASRARDVENEGRNPSQNTGFGGVRVDHVRRLAEQECEQAPERPRVPERADAPAEVRDLLEGDVLVRRQMLQARLPFVEGPADEPCAVTPRAEPAIEQNDTPGMGPPMLRRAMIRSTSSDTRAACALIAVSSRRRPIHNTEAPARL
jgi:hypothetical protein